MTPFELSDSSQSGHTRIVVLGELDIATAPELERELRQRLADPSCREIVLDLRSTSFIDSSGLRVLLLASRDAHAAGCRLLVVPGDGHVLRAIEMAQVAEHLELGDLPPETG